MASLLALRVAQAPHVLYSLHDEFRETQSATEHSNFLKGVAWSPDGLSFLTAADDNWLRVYDLPRAAFEPGATVEPGREAGPAQVSPAPRGDGHDPFWPAVRVHAGEAVYDYCWYSRASGADPPSCCFATTARGHPVHLWDACSGELRCSYRPYNALDELAPAYGVAFDPGGGRLYAGGHSVIHVFDVARPGRDHATLQTHRRGQEGQPGIISCMAFAPGGDVMAAGAYSGVAALYDARSSEQLCLLQGHTGGVTHLRFSADGNYVYTGARRDGALYCWDARHSSGVLYAIRRATAATNQRVAFDIEPCGRHLASGGEDGRARLYDLRDGSEVAAHRVAADTVTGCQFHPFLPLLATASGHRRLYLAPSDDESEGEGVVVCGVEEEERPAAGDIGRGRHGLTRDENVLRVLRFEADPVALEADPEALEALAPGGGMERVVVGGESEGGDRAPQLSRVACLLAAVSSPYAEPPCCCLDAEAV